MVRPSLLNSILVEIKQIDRDATVFDPVKREPSGVIVWKRPFKIRAQIYFGKEAYWSSATKTPDPRSMGGILDEAEGYIVVSKFDLSLSGRLLHSGDIITSYGNAGVETTCKLIIIGSKSAAHYSDVGQCTLEKWWFRDNYAG
jgi:hypothetical protein